MLLQVDTVEVHDWYDITKDIIIPSVGILLTAVGLFIAIKTLRDNLKIAKANFEFQMAVSHRDTWKTITSLGLKRICEMDADASTMTEEEHTHINFVLINVKNSYDARRRGILPTGKKERTFMLDVGEFFSFPLPAALWEKNKKFYQQDFQNFIYNSKLLYNNQPLPATGFKKHWQSFCSSINRNKQKLRQWLRNKRWLWLVVI